MWPYMLVWFPILGSVRTIPGRPFKIGTITAIERLLWGS